MIINDSTPWQKLADPASDASAPPAGRSAAPHMSHAEQHQLNWWAARHATQDTAGTVDAANPDIFQSSLVPGRDVMLERIDHALALCETWRDLRDDDELRLSRREAAVLAAALCVPDDALLPVERQHLAAARDLLGSPGAAAPLRLTAPEFRHIFAAVGMQKIALCVHTDGDWELKPPSLMQQRLGVCRWAEQHGDQGASAGVADALLAQLAMPANDEELILCPPIDGLHDLPPQELLKGLTMSTIKLWIAGAKNPQALNEGLRTLAPKAVVLKQMDKNTPLREILDLPDLQRLRLGPTRDSSCLEEVRAAMDVLPSLHELRLDHEPPPGWTPGPQWRRDPEQRATFIRPAALLRKTALGPLLRDWRIELDPAVARQLYQRTQDCPLALQRLEHFMSTFSDLITRCSSADQDSLIRQFGPPLARLLARATHSAASLRDVATTLEQQSQRSLVDCIQTLMRVEARELRPMLRSVSDAACAVFLQACMERSEELIRGLQLCGATDTRVLNDLRNSNLWLHLLGLPQRAAAGPLITPDSPALPAARGIMALEREQNFAQSCRTALGPSGAAQVFCELARKTSEVQASRARLNAEYAQTVKNRDLARDADHEDDQRARNELGEGVDELIRQQLRTLLSDMAAEWPPAAASDGPAAPRSAPTQADFGAG